MSTMVLAELIAWVAIAVADLGFGGAQQNMGTSWLQPMNQTQQGWVQPSLDYMLQMNNGGRPQDIGSGSLQASLDQTMNFMNGEKSPMGPNWPQTSLEHTMQMMSSGQPQNVGSSWFQPSLEHTAQMINGEKQDMGPGLQSTMDQMLDFTNGGESQETGAGSLQSALDQAENVMNKYNDWLEILLNETNYLIDGVDGLKPQGGPFVQFPLNQTTVTPPHHPELPPALNISGTKSPIEIPIEILNVTNDEASKVERILSKHGVKVSEDVLDIMNYAATNFTRNTARKIFTALYDEIDPVYHDVYKKKVIPELAGLSEIKQTLLDELLKTYNLTQSDKEFLSHTFVTRALADISKEIASGTTKDSEIRKRSKAIEQIMEKQRNARVKERERFNAMYGPGLYG